MRAVFLAALGASWTLLAGAAFAQPTATAKANPRLVRVGAPFQIVITLHSEENIVVQRPSFQSVEGLTLSNPEAGSTFQISVGGGHTESAQTFAAEYVASEPGTYDLGPFYIAYVDEKGESHELTVPAVTVEVHEDAPRPASNIILARIGRWWKYILTAFLLAVLAGLAAVLVRARKRTAGAAPAPVRTSSPEHDAVEQIKSLRIPGAEDVEAVKAYYDKVDKILRTYLTRRYNVLTRDLTTWEIQKEFRKRKRLDARAKAVFILINDCDWVKFAKSRPMQGEIERIPYRAAEALVGGIMERTQ